MCFTVTTSLVSVTQCLVPKSGQKVLEDNMGSEEWSLASEPALAVEKSAGFEEEAL